jgi:hypothetical protein
LFFFTARRLSKFCFQISGRVGSMAVALLWMKRFPKLRDVERLE